MLKQILPLLFTIIFSINLFAESHDIHKDILDIKLQIQEIKLTDARDDREKKIETLEKDIKELEEKFNQNNIDKKEIDGKIERNKAVVDNLNTFLTIYGILITILLALGSFATYKVSLKNAEEGAEKASNKWIEDNKDRILEPIINEGNNLLKNIRKEADILLQDYQSTMKKHNLKDELDSKEKDILEKVNILLESKETENYTFNDWSSKFLDYFYKNEFDNALKAIDNAIKITNNEIEVAFSLYNKAITFGRLGKSQEEIDVYDKLIEMFENSTENVILEQISKALYNKGVILRKLGKSDEAISVYNKLINKFENFEENNISAQVSMALFDKGFILGQLGEFEKAIKVYDEVIKKFKDSKENIILEQVSQALINKFEINLISGNSNLEEELFLSLKENKQYLIQLEMLQIIGKAKNSNQDNEIKEWKIKFKDTKLKDWSFDELKTWVETLEDEAKERVLKYIHIFENHNKNIDGK